MCVCYVCAVRLEVGRSSLMLIVDLRLQSIGNPSATGIDCVMIYHGRHKSNGAFNYPSRWSRKYSDFYRRIMYESGDSENDLQTPKCCFSLFLLLLLLFFFFFFFFFFFSSSSFFFFFFFVFLFTFFLGHYPFTSCYDTLYDVTWRIAIPPFSSSSDLNDLNLSVLPSAADYFWRVLFRLFPLRFPIFGGAFGFFFYFWGASWRPLTLHNPSLMYFGFVPALLVSGLSLQLINWIHLAWSLDYFPTSFGRLPRWHPSKLVSKCCSSNSVRVSQSNQEEFIESCVKIKHFPIHLHLNGFPLPFPSPTPTFDRLQSDPNRFWRICIFTTGDLSETNQTESIEPGVRMTNFSRF